METCDFEPATIRAISTGQFVGQQAPKQHFVDPATKSFLAANQNHGHAFVVLRSQGRIGVDIDFQRTESMALEDLFRLLA
jgi:hypothetical protein